MGALDYDIHKKKQSDAQVNLSDKKKKYLLRNIGIEDGHGSSTLDVCTIDVIPVSSQDVVLISVNGLER